MTICAELTQCLPVSIRSAGRRLCGIVHLPSPSVPEKNCSVVLFPAGPKYRVGPHRLYVHLARALSARGFRVLRADTFGVGDSEGEIPNGNTLHVYRLIENGLFIKDARLWADYFRQFEGAGQLILGGLCGGALTSLYVAEEIKEAAGVILLGLPVLVDEPGTIPDRRQAGTFLWQYVQRIARVGSWSRLLRQESDYRLMGQSIRGFLGITSRSAVRVNKKLIESLERYLASGRPGICVFGENDIYHSQFTQHFESRYGPLSLSLRKLFEFKVVEASDHSFSSPPAEGTVLKTVSDWLESICHHDFSRAELSGFPDKSRTASTRKQVMRPPRPMKTMGRHADFKMPTSPTE